MGTNFSATNEYALFVFGDDRQVIAKEERLADPDIRDLMNTAKGAAGNYLRLTGKTCFYPIYVSDMKIVGFGPVCPDDFHPTRNVKRSDGVLEVYPIDSEGIERKWVLARDTVTDHVQELHAKLDRKTGEVRIERRKADINYKTVWTDGKYSAKKYGTELLGDIVPETRTMPRLYPKSLHLVRDCIHAAMGDDTAATVCDYFAGSGTTGHAVIAMNRNTMNRESHGLRKYIQVEMGEHFDSVLKTRMTRVIYSKDWKDGKPVSRQGSSHIFKYLHLESYEDTLDNIDFVEPKAAQPELSLANEYALK
jgi:adenine-specific DNA-methyltransferase